MKLSDISSKTRLYVALLTCIGLWVAQFVFIVKNAVNVPFLDEWEAVNKGGIIVNQTISQLFAQHNEHRIVTTKLLTLMLYYFDDWNLITHQAINFVIYGLLVSALAYIVKKSVPEMPTWILLCFVLFTLTDVSRENHAWGFQSQFHFALLFLFLSVWFLFNKKQAWGKILGGAIFSVLSIYSFSSGVVESLVVLFGYSVFKLIRIRLESAKKREILQLALVLLIICGAIGFYFVGYIKPEHHPAYTLPYQKLFWTYFLNLLSGGFGYKVDNILPGCIIFFFVIIPLIAVIKQNGYKLSTGKWVIVISTLAILGSLVSITMGRAEFGKGHSKASRYSEITVMLIPLSVALWTFFLSEREKLRNYFLGGFWIFCLWSFLTYWNFSADYYHLSVERQTGLECVKNYYQNGGEANCLTLYPLPLTERLDFVKTVPVSFIKEMQNQNK